MGLVDTPAWRARAQCRRENAVFFFPPSHLERKDEKGLRETAARRLCASCGVREECLEYALTMQEQHGIWGGKNEVERRRMLRDRASV